MFYSDIDKLFDKLLVADKTPLWENYSRTFVPTKFAVEVKDEKAYIALSVLGHNPEDIEINCYEDKIEVKAKKEKKQEESPFEQLTASIDERVTLGKDLDGRSAKAEIKNGILTLIIERKEESKPKKVQIKIG